MTRRSLRAKIATVDAGGWTAVASAPTLDRDGEVIAAGAFEPLPASVPVHLNHELRVESLVGRARPRYQGGKLIIDGVFAGTELAASTRQLVLDGTLNTMSVVFIGSQRKTIDQVPTITRAELVAVDFVSIPSNRDAVVLSARSLQNRTPGQARLMAFKAGITALEADLASLPAPPNHQLYRQLAELEKFLTDRRR
jgi:HK97 family phage prohead protease